VVLHALSFYGTVIIIHSGSKITSTLAKLEMTSNRL